MPNIFRYSDLSTTIDVDGERQLLYHIELIDFVRGFCGALFFALPLHYTFEMWERARVISNFDVALILMALYLANVGFVAFTGFRVKGMRKNIWFDSLESYGIGIVASAITMLLIGQISSDAPLEVILKVIALEAVPTSFGASIAKNSFANKTKSDSDIVDALSMDVKKVIGATLGAIMVAFNVAPTIEPVQIASFLQWQHLVGITLFSLIVSYLITFTSGFASDDEERRGILKVKWVETLVAYIIALIVSGLLLWMFGYLDSDTSVQLALPWIIVLGYCTTLGASAGRIIL